MSWNHNQILLDKVKDKEIRKWYAKETKDGWSVLILTLCAGVTYFAMINKFNSIDEILENKEMNVPINDDNILEYEVINEYKVVGTGAI